MDRPLRRRGVHCSHSDKFPFGIGCWLPHRRSDKSSFRPSLTLIRSATARQRMADGRPRLALWVKQFRRLSSPMQTRWRRRKGARTQGHIDHSRRHRERSLAVWADHSRHAQSPFSAVRRPCSTTALSPESNQESGRCSIKSRASRAALSSSESPRRERIGAGCGRGVVGSAFTQVRVKSGLT
jgi:hypothetical protein